MSLSPTRHHARTATTAGTSLLFQTPNNRHHKLSHFIARCRDPVICWSCRASGQVKKRCPLALQPVNQAQAPLSKATSLEPIVPGCPSSLDVLCPLARDLNSLISTIFVEPAAPTLVPWLHRLFSTSRTLGHYNSAWVPNSHQVQSSQSSRTGSETSASLHVWVIVLDVPYNNLPTQIYLISWLS